MSNAPSATGPTLIELIAQFLHQCHLEESSAILLEESSRLDYPWIKLSPSTAKTIHDALLSNCLEDIASEESGSFKTDDGDRPEGTDSDANEEDSSSNPSSDGQLEDENPQLWDAVASAVRSPEIYGVDESVNQNLAVNASASCDEYEDDNDCG
jgi:hypothetical protein